MEQMSTNSIELIYMNNVIRKSLGSVEYDEYDHMLREKFWMSIFKLLEEDNHPFDEKRGHFYLLYNDGISPIIVGEEISPIAKSIIYSEIVVVNNAYRYDEVNGVVLFRLQKNQEVVRV